MPSPEVSIVFPAHNERQLLPECISSVVGDIMMTGAVENAELVVVASRCTDGTAAVAREQLAGFSGIQSQVISVRKKGKKAALNAGLEATSADLVICVDSDTSIAAGALGTAVAELQDDDAHLVGGQYAPVVEPGWVNVKPAPTLELLKHCRRLTTQPHRQVVGRFMAFRRHELPESGFPAGRSADDTWLSAYMGTRYGLEGIRVSGRVFSTYLPPMTLIDISSQLRRYRQMDGIIRGEHPELARHFEELHEHWARTDAGKTDKDWRAKAEECGIDFERWRDKHDAMLALASRSRLGCQMSARTDFWAPQASTKRRPAELTFAV